MATMAFWTVHEALIVHSAVLIRPFSLYNNNIPKAHAPASMETSNTTFMVQRF
jgi:hypothetical protein